MTKNTILNNINLFEKTNGGNVKEFFSQNGISFAEHKESQEPKGNLYKFLVSNGISQSHDTVDPDGGQVNNALDFLFNNGNDLEGINSSET